MFIHFNILLKHLQHISNINKNVPGRISFAIDAWTAITITPFLGITSHWISADWELKSVNLDFIKLIGPHSGENMCDAFVQSLKDFGILTKVGIILNINFGLCDTKL